MALIKLDRLYKVKSKGKTYCYAWRGGPRIEAPEGTKEFSDEYFFHNNPTAQLDRRKLATWIVLFKASPEWAAFSQKTKNDWAPKLDDACRKFGALSIRAFENPKIRIDIKEWRDQWRDRPRTADKAKQALSRLFSYLIEGGIISTNPCAGIADVYTSDRAEIIWLEEDLQVLAAVASPEIMWAVRFAMLTGLRQSACLQATWARVTAFSLDMRGTIKGKAKGRGLIPMYPALKALLDEIPRRAPTILTTTRGKSWGIGFSASWDTAMNRSGLKSKGLHFHDLRGTAATNLYRAGLTSREIAEVLGWKMEEVERMINVYVKRDELLLDRIRRMERIGTFDGGKTEQA